MNKPISANLEINGLTGTFMGSEFLRLSKAICRYLKKHTPKGTRLIGSIGTSDGKLILSYQEEQPEANKP